MEAGGADNVDWREMEDRTIEECLLKGLKPEIIHAVLCEISPHTILPVSRIHLSNRILSMTDVWQDGGAVVSALTDKTKKPR